MEQTLAENQRELELIQRELEGLEVLCVYYCMYMCMYICFMLLWRFQCIQLKIFPDTQQTLWAGVTISYTIWLCMHTRNLIVPLTHCGCYMKQDSYILVTSVHWPSKDQCTEVTPM